MMEVDCRRGRIVGMEADKRLRVRFYKAVWVTEKPVIYTLSEWEKSLAIVQWIDYLGQEHARAKAL